MVKRPWFPFYPADWLGERNVRMISREARSCYFDLLCEIWSHGPVNDDPDFCAHLLNESPRGFRKIWAEIRPLFFEISPGKLSQNRLEFERNEAESKAEKARNSAQSRWAPNANALRPHSDRSANEMLARASSQSHPQSQLQDPPTVPPREESRPTDPEPLKLASPPAQPRAPKSKVKQLDDWQKQAEPLLAELNAARKRVRPSSRDYSATTDNLRGIAERLAKGATVEDVKHVILVREVECRANPDAFQWFDAVTPFRSENFSRALGRDASGQPIARASPLPQSGRRGFVEPMAHIPEGQGNDDVKL